jgi:superfamily II DNA helicase RecQ
MLLCQDIADLKYRVIVVNPEELMRPGGGFESLFKKKSFADKIISIIIDEAHCVSQWGSFRPEYRHIGSLRHLQCTPCTMMVTSATLTPRAISDVKSVLSLREDNLFFSQCSIDRPNINIVIRPMLNPRKTFVDLAFLLRNWKPGDPPPPKFLIFFDNISESVEAGRYLCSLLPMEYRSCVQWFNSEMSDRFKVEETLKFINNEVWGLLATDSFGMVSVLHIRYLCN